MKLEDQLFELKFSSKQMERLSRKAEKEEAKEKAKCKKALQTRNRETAQIYAENAIRKKNESLNYLRMAGRMDAVASRIQTAMSTQVMMKDLSRVTKSLSSVMSSMDLEKVEKVMGDFERQFEDLDVRAATMDNAMSSATATSMPMNDVDALMNRIAEENDLDVMTALPEAGASSAQKEAPSRDAEEDALTKRLAGLRETAGS